MRVIHVPYTYFPDACGGTEVYVQSLVNWLIPLGVTSQIAAPGSENQRYSHQGLEVSRFGVQSSYSDLKSLYGNGDAYAAKNFGDILDVYRPDICHLHAVSPAVSIRLVLEAEKRNVPIVLTYHSPTVSCQRGTLMRWGEQVCDGVARPRLCGACTLHAHGVPRLLAQAISLIPPSGIEAIAGTRSGGLWTGLRQPALIRERVGHFHQLITRAACIVTLSGWAHRLLVSNGVPLEKLFQSRQRVAFQPSENQVDRRAKQIKEGPFRLVFMGRLDPTKGLHILLKALAKSPSLEVLLDAYVIEQGESKYANEVRKMAASDQRIRILQSVPAASVVSTLSQYDAVAVPSQWLEIGPLVVLEAFAAGRPVLGARLGGIEELVSPGVNGVLLRHDDVDEWAAAIRKATENGQVVSGPITPPESMKQSAAEMVELYGHILNQ